MSMFSKFEQYYLYRYRSADYGIIMKNRIQRRRKLSPVRKSMNAAALRFDE